MQLEKEISRILRGYFVSVFYLNSSVAAAFLVMLYGVRDWGGRAEELRNMELHTCRKSCSGLGQDTTFSVCLHSRGSTELLGRAPCVSLPYLMGLLLIFSAEFVFGGEHQFLTLSTLLFHVVAFQTIGNFAIGFDRTWIRPWSFQLQLQNSSLQGFESRADAELGDLAVLGMLDSMALEGLFQPKPI